MKANMPTNTASPTRMKNDLADAIASGNIERITGQVSRLSAALGSRLPLPAEARP